MHSLAARSFILCAFLSLSASAEDAAQTFNVFEFRVLGNHVLPQVEVEKAVYPHLGPDKTLQDVEGARVALEQAYKSAGYGTVFVDIPEQNVEEGIVRLHVTEGTLDRIRVQGARYVSAKQIREELPEARQGAVPSLPVLQQQLADYNAQATYRSLVPVLAAGRQPGTVDLTLKVDDHLPVHATLEVNNQYTADTSRLRALASVSYDNLFNHMDSVSLQYQTAPQELSELDVLALSYSMRVGSHGQTLTLYHVDSNSDVAALGTLSVLGAGKVFGTRLSVPLENTASGYYSFTFGLDYKDFSENIRVDADNAVRTPISYTNASIGQTNIWRSPRFNFTFDNTLNFGVRGFGNGSDEFADKGFKTRPNYFYVRSNAVLNTPFFFKDWGLQARLSGQYAVDPVISNEQFAIGGADGVRGYLEAEELADMGVKASLQVSAPTLRFGDDRLQLGSFAFFDAGRVSAIEPLGSEPRNTDLRSAGLGVNAVLFRLVDGSLVWAFPLVDGSRTQAHESRLLFSVRASW
jgi:hemolysin activation/secretion protein